MKPKFPSWRCLSRPSLIALRSDSVKDTLEIKLLAWVALILAVLIGIVGVAVQNTRQAVAASDWVNHTHAVILEADALITALHAAEAAQRNFLITGHAWDQESYRKAFNDMANHLQVLKTLAASDRRRRPQLEVLEPLIARQVEFDKSLIQIRQDSGLEGVKTALTTNSGRLTLLEIGQAIDRLKQEENILLQQRDQTSQAKAGTTRAILFGGVGLNFLFLGLLFWLIRRDLALRRHTTATLAEANVTLEAKIEERTGQLAKTVEALETENLERRWGQASVERLYRHGELIINSIAEGVFVVSRRGNLIKFNPAGARMVGWESQDLTGRSLHTILRRVRPDGSPLPWESDPVFLAMKQDRELQGETAALCRKDGVILPVRYGCRPMRDSDKVVGAVLTFVDLSPPRPDR